MKFRGTDNFHHDREERVGVLLTNLGSPAAPTASALRPYLKEFLSDPRVVEFPKLLWWLVLNGVILQIRPRKSAEAYSKVWTDSGSPLLLHTKGQSEKLQAMLREQWGDSVLVDWAMRYGEPSISSKINSMLEAGVTKLLVLPLYPQYSASTSASTFDAVAEDFRQRRWLPDFRFVTHYYDYEPYIEGIAASVKDHIETHGRPEKILFSYHGIPQRYLTNGDPYHCQCLKTTRLVRDKLGEDAEFIQSTFQSRFGREEWLRPYTDETLKALAKNGTKHVAVICPGFSSDCLETIEEIDEENRDYFMSAGGETFHYIKCLNASDAHISVLNQLVTSEISHWLSELKHRESTEYDLRQSRYDSCPYNKNSN